MPGTPHQITKQDRIVWADCEMTGLDPDRHVLVEIAVIITDAQLNPLDDGIDIVIHATEEELSRMDDYVTNMHESNGLTEQIKASTVSVAEAEQQVLDYVKKYVPVSGQVPLAGNSIGTDRLFINRYMPQLGDYLHYRMIDVSSIKELARRWYPRVYNGQPDKGMAHRALADIQESIRELAFYRNALMPAQDISTGDVNAAAKAAIEQFPIEGS